MRHVDSEAGARLRLAPRSALSRSQSSEAGIALLSVIAVLTALVLIATPFALSMRGQYEASVYDSSAFRSRLAAESVVTYARGVLRRSCQPYDPTPDYDDQSEFDIDLSAIAAEFFVDESSGGENLLSVRVWDEQGKINLNSASPELLGSLFGKSRAAGEFTEDDTEIQVEDAGVFAPDGGFVYVNGEMIQYTSANGGTLSGCRRGAQPDGFLYSDPLPIPRGASVLDGRVIRLVEGRLSATRNPENPYRSLDDLRRVCEEGELFFHPAETREFEPYLTVHSMRNDEKSWVNSQRVFGFVDDQQGLPTILVPNGRYYGAGTVVKLTDGANVHTTIVARQAGRASVLLDTAGGNQETVQGDRLVLLGTIRVELDIEHLKIFSESRHPVNLNSAADEVFLALFTGLRTRGEEEDEVTEREVRALLSTIREDPVVGREDLLERVLRPAVEEGLLSPRDISAIYINVLNSNDRRVSGGTAPLCFKSSDVYEIVGTSIVSNRAGIELARHTLREVAHVAPRGESTFVLQSQDEFEDQILPSRMGRWIHTTPFNVARYERDNNPPSRYFMNRVRRVYASRDREGDDGEDEGDVRLRPVRATGPVSDSRFVEHFDTFEDPDGYRTEEGAFRVPVRTSNGALAPLALEFWFRPDGGSGDSVLVDYGRSSRTEDRLSLIHQPSQGRVVFEVADPSLQDPRTTVEEVASVEFPLTLQDQTWYHFGLHARGSKPSDLTLMIDGNPEPADAGFLTRLTSSVDQSDTSIQVEDAEDFPAVGVIRIGGEIVPYSSRTKTGFSLGSSNPRVAQRGGRGTVSVAHEVGEAVELYGYSNPIVSDIPVGGASLDSSVGIYQVALLNAPSNSRVPQGIGAYPGIESTATEVPLRSLDNDVNDTSFMDAFQDSGYAFVIAGRWRLLQGNLTIARFGGMELIHYGGVQGTTLVDVTRAVQTKNVNGLGQAKIFVNEHPNAPTVLAPTLVIPISIEASGIVGGEEGTYLDPEFTQNTERIQFGDEWAAYDSIEAGPSGGGTGTQGSYFVRNPPDDFAAIQAIYNRAFIARDVVQPGSGGGPGGPRILGAGSLLPVLPLLPAFFQPPLDIDYAVTSEEINTALYFRGVDNTEVLDHPSGEDVIPCFRVRGRGVGFDDYITVIDAEGLKEGHRVKWAASGPDSIENYDGLRSPSWGRGTHHFVALEENVSQRIYSTIRLRRKAGPPTDFEIYDTPHQELTRLLKFPSGELPRIARENLVIGSQVDGSSPAIGHLDEVSRVRTQLYAYVMNLGAGVETLREDDEELPVFRANGRISDRGGVRPDDYIPSGGPLLFSPIATTAPAFEIPALARDTGILRIGEELIAYRDVEDQGGEPPVFVFKDLIRGFLGSPKGDHSRFETVVPLLHLPTALVDGGASGETSEVPVTDSRGFADQGCLSVVNGLGERGELMIYTNRSRRLFTMPMTGDAEIGDGVGVFRGRYGTATQSLQDGDVLLQMPIRFWDRYRELSDDPELSFYQASATIPSGYFTRITWEEVMLKPSIDVKMLLRIDGRARWDDPPLGVENGLFLFENPVTQDRSNRIDMQGDTVEIRVYFSYEPGAFNTSFTSDSWKETPWLQGLTLHYVAPSMTLWREEE